MRKRSGTAAYQVAAGNIHEGRRRARLMARAGRCAAMLGRALGATGASFETLRVGLWEVIASVTSFVEEIPELARDEWSRLADLLSEDEP